MRVVAIASLCKFVLCIKGLSVSPTCLMLAGNLDEIVNMGQKIRYGTENEMWGRKLNMRQKIKYGAEH